MSSNYFSKNRRLKKKIDKLKEKRLVNDGFHYPLGIMPDDNSINPIEGVKIEFSSTPLGDMYFYDVCLSANRSASFFKSILRLFPYYITLVIERSSEDVNRECDILLSDTDISLKEAKRLFSRYEDFWCECGFVGFGVLDESTGFEIFIDSHKEIEITVPSKYTSFVDKVIEMFCLSENDKAVFLSDLEHWHYSLSYLVGSKNNNLDYYYVVNNLKHKYGFKLINELENDIIVLPRWWHVTIKGLGKCKKRSFLITYYLVAETFEEMETLIDNEMNNNKMEYYYIHDYYNVDPKDITEVFHIRKKGIDFNEAQFGIWAETEVVLNNTKNLTSYIINKPNATTY